MTRKKVRKVIWIKETGFWQVAVSIYCLADREIHTYIHAFDRIYLLELLNLLLSATCEHKTYWHPCV